ncbi:MAG: hypothetical protein NTU85_03325 [Candidatus Kaiserbacteria bacterium]|nr:hypothetical protein [Candidatus Kaiserbacteria bacterium]
MSQTLEIKTTSVGRRVIVELDANRLERLASNLGFYGLDFLKSIDRAERDYKAGRVREVGSLSELRRKK